MIEKCERINDLEIIKRDDYSINKELPFWGTSCSINATRECIQENEKWAIKRKTTYT